jgi:Tol biopolymer transport system component
MPTSPVDHDAVREQLDRVLRSTGFRRADRSSALLRYVVERTIAGHSDGLKEYTLGVEVMGRGPNFDQRTDPVVRAEASRLRDRLARYYASDEGNLDTIIIELPKGSYVPRFVARPPAAMAASHAANAATSAIAEPARTGSRFGFGVVAAGIVLAAAVIVAARMHSSAGSVPAALPLRFEVELKSDGLLGSEVGADVALSSDGSRLVFTARDAEGLAHLYTRRLDQSVAVKLPGTDGGRVPFLSPDGHWVGFFAGGKVKRIAVDGGSPVVLCDATDLLGASWGEDGTIIAALNPSNRLWRIPETGGAPRAVLDMSASGVAPVWPQLLPGGDAVLFSTLGHAGADPGDVEIASLKTGARVRLVHGGTYGRYLPNGYLTYVNQGTLYAIPFDLARRSVHGRAMPVLEDVAYSRTFGYAQLDIAATGTLVYRRSAGSGQFSVALLDRAGTTASLTPSPGRYGWPRLSPDGRSLAFSSVESDVPGLRIGGTDGGALARVTGPGGDYVGLTWLPDGRHLIVGSRHGMAWIDAAHPAAPRALTTSAGPQVPWSVAPGGRLAYHELNPTTGFDLLTVQITATAAGITLGEPEPFLRTSAFEVYPAFSADGRWIAYGSNESGAFEVYVRHFPDSGAAVRISTDGGWIPEWSPNGRDLLYETNDDRLMAVGYRVEHGTFVAEPPRQWTTQQLGDAGVFPSFAVAHDADHVLALLPAARPEDRQTANHVTVVLNFFDEVRRRAGEARSPR